MWTKRTSRYLFVNFEAQIDVGPFASVACKELCVLMRSMIWVFNRTLHESESSVSFWRKAHTWVDDEGFVGCWTHAAVTSQYGLGFDQIAPWFS